MRREMKGELVLPYMETHDMSMDRLTREVALMLAPYAEIHIIGIDVPLENVFDYGNGVDYLATKVTLRWVAIWQ